MNYSEILTDDVANGLGFRTSLFVSGCRHNCPGCFNHQAADFKFGKKFTQKVAKKVLDSLSPEYIRGLTVLGGDPMEPENQPEVYNLLRDVRFRYGTTKDIWLYTGAIYENIINRESRYRTDYTNRLLALIDVLVDGPFILEKRDIQFTPFRGSTNQRLIDMKETLKNNNEIVLYKL